MKKFIFISIILFTTSVWSQARNHIGHCQQDDAICLGEGLINQIGQESATVPVHRMIRNMRNRCDRYNFKCTSRFVSRAINFAFSGHDEDDDYGTTYTVTQNEITDNNYKRTAWCEPGDKLLSGNCTGFYDGNWAPSNGKVTRGYQEGWACNNHRKRINEYTAQATCMRQ